MFHPPSIDFNDAIFLGVGVQCVLDVAFSNDAEMPDNLESSRTKHMIFIIRKGLGRGNDDRISGVCSQWVKVFHVTANNSVLHTSVDTRTIRGVGKWILTSAPSRTTSYSSSFQPFILRSIRTWGLKLRLFADRSRSSSASSAKPEPRPPRVKADRKITG